MTIHYKRGVEIQTPLVRSVSVVAARVAKLVFDSPLARVERPADVVAFFRQHVYKPEYAAETAPASIAA